MCTSPASRSVRHSAWEMRPKAGCVRSWSGARRSPESLFDLLQVMFVMPCYLVELILQSSNAGFTVHKLTCAVRSVVQARLVNYAAARGAINLPRDFQRRSG